MITGPQANRLTGERHRPILPHVETAPVPAGNELDAKRLKWEAKQKNGTRPLGAWELYRALNDALDEGHDQFDLSNRDARLAIILMGGLNAGLVILRSEEHTSELQSQSNLVCRLLLEKKKKKKMKK